MVPVFATEMFGRIMQFFHRIPRTFCLLVMVFHQLSICHSTLKVAIIPRVCVAWGDLTLIQVGIFQDQCGKLSFNWMVEQCAFGTSFHI